MRPLPVLIMYSAYALASARPYYTLSRYFVKSYCIIMYRLCQGQTLKKLWAIW
jgi:hypothetical protein